MISCIGRSSDLDRIMPDRVVEGTSEIRFKIFGAKNFEGESEWISIPAGDPLLCPVRHWKELRARQRSWPGADLSSAVWWKRFSTRSGGDAKVVSLGSDAIAKNVLETMAAAGVNTSVFKTHSLRGAVVSKAREMGVSLEDVMRQGRWRSVSTVESFYDRSDSGQKVVGAVLFKKSDTDDL